MKNNTEIKPNVYLPLAIQEVIEWLRKDHEVMEWSVLWRVNNIDWKLMVTDIFIPKQKNQAAYTEMDNPSSDLVDFLIENNRIDEIGEWRLWLHSHQKMNPFWSWTDSNTRTSLCSDVFYDKEKQLWWSLSIVIWTKWWASYHWTIDVYKWEKWKWIQYSQDVNVVCWLWDSDWFSIKDEELDRYIESLWYTWYDNSYLSMFPKYIVDVMSEKWILDYNKKIELEKSRYYNYMKMKYKMSKDIEKDQKIIDLWYMKWLNTLEFYVNDLKEKEKRPLPVWTDKDYNYKKHNKKKEGNEEGGSYKSVTREMLIDAWLSFNLNTLLWEDDEWFSWTFKEAQQYVNSITHSVDDYEDNLFYTSYDHNDLYREWFTYSDVLKKYRNPYTWQYITMQEAIDYLNNS